MVNLNLERTSHGFGMMKLYAHPDNYKTKKAELINFDQNVSKRQPLLS